MTNAEQVKKPAKKAPKKSERKVAPARMRRQPKRAMYQPTAPAWKDDAGKVRLDLLPFAALEDVARVLEYGAEKYAPQGWRHLEGGHERYVRAALRHLHAHAGGEMFDPESGLPHLAHAACSLLFALELPQAVQR